MVHIVLGRARGLFQLFSSQSRNKKVSASYLYLATFVKECPECLGPLIGRNILMENISAIIFSQHFEQDEHKQEAQEFEIFQSIERD